MINKKYFKYLLILTLRKRFKRIPYTKPINTEIIISKIIINILNIWREPESIDLINELKPKNSYFIHISHLMGLHDEISEILPPNIFLSYDGLKINL